MNNLKKILFVIAMLILVTQTVRHGYLKWFEKRSSVLDKYDTSTCKKIKEAKTLKELLQEHDAAHKKVEIYEQDKNNPVVPENKKQYKEPYKTQEELRNAIENWESKSKEIYELRFFWSSGLLILAIGLLFYKKINNWLGISLIIVGFVEMIWWTSPSFNFGGAYPEFDRLLVNKLLLSIITLALLSLLWLLNSREKS